MTLMSYASLSPSSPKRRLYNFTNASNDRSFVTVSGSHFICIMTLIRIDINNGISLSNNIFTPESIFTSILFEFHKARGKRGP